MKVATKKQSGQSLYREKANIFLNSLQGPQNPDLSKPDVSKQKSLASSDDQNDTYQIKAVFAYEGKDWSLEFEINNSRTTKELLERILQWLKKDFNYNGSVSDLLVTLKEKVIRENLSLADAGITSSTELLVCIPSLSYKTANQRAVDEQSTNTRRNELLNT